MKYVSKNQAVEILSSGGLVIIPTETVYGLAGDATNIEAVKKIYEYKNRPSDNPLICHFYSKSHIQEYVQEIPEPIEILIDRFMPGPLTVLLEVDSNDLLPATLGKKQVACRIPDNRETLEIIRLLEKPVAAPSANPSGKPSSTTEKMAYDYFVNFPGGIIKSNPCRIGLESTIIRMKDGRIEILRDGFYGKKELQEVLPDIEITKLETQEIVVPGNKYKHYSPETPIYEIDSKTNFAQLQETSVIITTNETGKFSGYRGQILIVSENNNPGKISEHLYETLVKVDKLDVQIGYWYVPNFDDGSSIAKALKNRLGRALGKK